VIPQVVTALRPACTDRPVAFQPSVPVTARPVSSAHEKGERTVNPEVLLGAVIGASAGLLAVTVVFDAYEKSIEQRMRAEVVVQKLRQNAERERSRISVQWEG
jgi:hypothetical protein